MFVLKSTFFTHVPKQAWAPDVHHLNHHIGGSYLHFMAHSSITNSASAIVNSCLIFSTSPNE